MDFFIQVGVFGKEIQSTLLVLVLFEALSSLMNHATGGAFLVTGFIRVLLLYHTFYLLMIV